MEKIFLAFLGVLMVGNLVFLDFQWLKSTREAVAPISSELQSYPLLVVTNVPTPTLTVTLPSLPAFKPTATVVTPVPNEAREFFISFGSGSSLAGDWEDVLGAEAYIDKSKYGLLKEVIFEASLIIPTGNERAFVRLYNVSDRHPVWNSEIFLEGGEAKLLLSSPINLDDGKKLYRVQMKTSLKYPANLIQARLKITI